MSDCTNSRAVHGPFRRRRFTPGVYAGLAGLRQIPTVRPVLRASWHRSPPQHRNPPPLLSRTILPKRIGGNVVATRSCHATPYARRDPFFPKLKGVRTMETMPPPPKHHHAPPSFDRSPTPMMSDLAIRVHPCSYAALCRSYAVARFHHPPPTTHHPQNPRWPKKKP
jgi:hypothetical protein